MDLPSIGDPAELIALASEITCQAAGRYRLAAERAQRSGRRDLARIFVGLAEGETVQLQRIQALADRRLEPHPVPAAWLNAIEPLLPALDLAELVHARPYAALAEAVREKERVFRLFSFLSGQAEDPTVERLAEALAKQQLRAAHDLRRSRRAAFHEARAEETLWPDPQQVETLADLVGAAETAETAFLRMIERQALSVPVATAIAQATLGALPALERPREDGGRGDGSLEPVLDRALEAFAFYDAVTGHAGRQDVLDKAQELTAMALTRIELICEADGGGGKTS